MAVRETSSASAPRRTNGDGGRISPMGPPGKGGEWVRIVVERLSEELP